MQTTTLSETSFFGDTNVGACGDGRSSKTVSPEFLGVSMLRRAGMLAVFLLALCLLGVDDARAGEIFSLEIDQPGEPESGNYPPEVYHFPDEEKYKFTYDGVTYQLKYVFFNDQRVQMRMEPQVFPPSGQVASTFDLRLGGKNSGVYTEIDSFNFGNPSVSPSGTGGYYVWNTEPFNPNIVYKPRWDGYRTAVVRITGPEAPNNSLRFASYPTAPANSGRLEIFDAAQGDDGQWKWVCDDNFGVEEAQVACRQLGLPTSGAAVWAMPSNWLTYRLGDPWSKGFVLLALSQSLALLDDVDCDGDESKLIDCDHAGRGVNDCAVAESVGVTCPSQ